MPTINQLIRKPRAKIKIRNLSSEIKSIAFSSLAATPDWLKSDSARRFMRAYRDARGLLLNSAPAEIARIEKDFFPNIDLDVLTETIAFYQGLGCWTPHLEITQAAFEGAVDVFLHAGIITRRHGFELAVSAPPTL